MHLLIFDPHDRGHYFTYVRYLLEVASIAPMVTLVLRRDARTLETFNQQIASRLGRAELDPSIQAESYRRGGDLVHDFTQALARHRPDHVWVPNGDLLARHLGSDRLRRPWHMRNGAEAEVGIIEARFHRPPKRTRGHLRFWFDRTMLAAGPWTRIHTIDPTLAAWAAKRPRGPMTSRIALIPDPLDPFEPISREQARQELGIPVQGRYLSAVGSHAMPRKGSALLLEAFVAANLSATDRLLLSGPLGAELAGRIARDFGPLVRDGRLVLINRYLSDEEVMQSLAAADLVCTPYFDHAGSSGIVLKAAQAQRPVLVPRFGWLGDVVPAIGLGEASEILTIEPLRAKLGPALDAAATFVPSASAARLAEYSLHHNFAAHWSSRLRRRLGLPAVMAERTWEWVLDGR
jgi:hypothetical protein